MKNLHVLPTDCPSRLRYNIKTRIWELDEFPKYHTDIKSTHNIYITSEEEIKEGDWYLDTSMKSSNFAVNKCDSERLETVAKQFKNLFKKIILTTDQKLIVGNVQPISGEFLQQFIKNSNCEFVETERLENGRYVNFLPNGGTEEGVYENYKIIIPSKESKQGRTCTNNCSVVCGECQIFDKKPITNLEKLLFPELVTELVGYYKNTQLVEKPKQELDCPYNFTSRCTIGRCDCKPKEVVEKTTKMYSEEEVKTIINDIVEKHCTYFRQETKDSVKLEWFKKFKK